MKEKIIAIAFILILVIFFGAGLIKKEEEISTMERRKLTTKESLKKDFLGSLEKYYQDQFPLRNKFLSLYSFVDRNLFKNGENNGLYIVNDFLIEKNYPLNDKNIEGFIEKINTIEEKYLKNNQTFYSLIPDKSYFLKDVGFQKIDYKKMIGKVKKEISVPYIDLFSTFALEDYYKTDIHLKQEAYDKAISVFSPYFSFPKIVRKDTIKTYSDFYGSSFSKGTFLTKKENLNYLTNEWTEKAHVWHLEYGDKAVYDIEKLGSLDSYSVFLSGPSSLIEMNNPNATTSKELVLFRDSFGSSLAPLLLPYYKKITLIDLRYITMDEIAKHVIFENQDVLFLYSTKLVNESNLLKVKTS